MVGLGGWAECPSLSLSRLMLLMSNRLSIIEICGKKTSSEAISLIESALNSESSTFGRFDFGSLRGDGSSLDLF